MLSVITELTTHAQAKAIAATRLRHSVWEASVSGVPQREIAQLLGISQPAVSQFIATTKKTDPLTRGPIGQRLLEHRSRIMEIAARYNMTDLAVFGSVARGEDTPESDVDIFVTTPANTGMMTLSRLEIELHDATGLTFDINAREFINGEVAADVLSKGIPL